MKLFSKSPELAHIRLEECIGCSKCIQACPFDAIIGAPKQLHLVLTEACVGCGLCISPCPVDCIEMHSVSQLTCSSAQAQKQVKRRKARLRPIISPPKATKEPVSKESDYVQSAVKRYMEFKNKGE